MNVAKGFYPRIIFSTFRRIFFFPLFLFSKHFTNNFFFLDEIQIEAIDALSSFLRHCKSTLSESQVSSFLNICLKLVMHQLDEVRFAVAMCLPSFVEYSPGYSQPIIKVTQPPPTPPSSMHAPHLLFLVQPSHLVVQAHVHLATPPNVNGGVPDSWNRALC